ncbi:hypothetical protein ONR75_07395 [Rhodopseudomonas sp. P2A-2r]|uniref:hypothetical protein n=1 Tax=Rhodopseudomonas sp. P2A-2r TaxID=2991972 RepID=UPI002234209F|nr:hypothetical protein [Rhodopseudomonas sp. P2A-2r]UZE50504.1 hypothetical protein ONR75_07395 [Rhodopseudomonas sp. P2A-2r]
MRTEMLLTNEPPASVKSAAELYAIAFEQAETAARRYGELATTGDESFKLVRSVFVILEQRELQRARALSLACVALLNKHPDPADLKWAPSDLVPAEELSELAGSSLSTPYGAWALAVRHRERGFVFWTYVAALAEDDAVRAAAESMAREALNDGNELRRERRLAWRHERHLSAGDGLQDKSSEIPLAALLESLLLKDIVAWSQDLPAIERGHLLAVTGGDLTERLPVPAPMRDMAPDSDTIEDIRCRAIRRAEQLSSIYLDEADHAQDQPQLELALKLAAHAITRLADLRTMAAASAR